MSAPRWCKALLRRLAPDDAADDVVGDLEEAHGRRLVRRSGFAAYLLTSLDAADMAIALVRGRRTRRREAIGLEAGVAGRSRRGSAIGVSWLDFKLGFRMLVRYPGLTLVGGLAMAFAIWAGAGAFEIVSQLVAPRLPLPDGDRIVGLQNWDAQANRVDAPLLHDFETWREELETIEDLGAFRTLERTLITGDGRAEPVEVAEISASAFRMTGATPLLGRTLQTADERVSSGAVAVIGHDVWQRRFGGDPEIVGRTLRLGQTPTTIVGVMPEGFTFPVAQSLWLPLRLRAQDYERGTGPGIRVFGRLAPGVSMDKAAAELAAVGQRTAAEHPSNEHLRPRVLPYARSIMNISVAETALLLSSNLVLVLLLVLICGNVALLMFARAATRESEIVVRNALGASRGRIVTQLFAEALVLGTAAAIVGLAAAGFGLRWAIGVGQAELMNGARLPFWIHPGLSPRTVVYAVMLTLLASAIAGVLPALKVTRGLQVRLREAATGGGAKFGGVWTLVIIAQVAVTVAFPFTAWMVRRDVVAMKAVDVGFPVEEYLSVTLEMDRDPLTEVPSTDPEVEFLSRFATSYRDLENRLESEPEVLSITYANRLPRMYHPARLIEVDAGGAAPLHEQWPAHRVSSANVALDFFDALSTPLLSGRTFHLADIGMEENGVGAVIVNEAYVTRVLGDRNPIGRRLRYVHFEEDEGEWLEEGPWYEIVGVVGNIGMSSDEFDPKVARVYHPAVPEQTYPMQMAVQVAGPPEAFVPKLRQIAATADPTLRVHEAVRMDRIIEPTLEFMNFWFRLLLTVSAIALLLSLTGIYSVMSYTVARRTREIGIRTALGGSARSIVLAIFSRSFVQVGLGIAAGAALAGALAYAASATVTVRGVALIGAYSVLMMAVCLMACVVPTRRALRVEPTEAMRAD